MKLLVRIFSCFTLITTCIIPLYSTSAQTATTTSTSTIDYNYLISDSELADSDALSQTDILNFLVQNGSFLKNYFMDTGEGRLVSATEMIYRAAQLYQINPKFLLVLVQKEQSLLTSDSPSQRALDYAAGYGCPDSSPCNERWRGFNKQVISAAAQFRYYLDNIKEYYYQPGKTYRICNNSADGKCATVTPKNVSTAALYIYTPHLHGNELFKTLWDKYFSKSHFPDGSILQVKKDKDIWLIQDGEKRKFATKAAFASRYSVNQILTVEQTDIDAYPTGDPIEYAANTLVVGPDKTYYMLTDQYKRKIASQKVFKLIGFNPSEADEITADQLADIPDGTDITEKDNYPTGALLQDKTTGGVYYIEANTKHPIWAKELMKANYPKMKIYPASQKTLQQFPDGDPVIFKDGVLIKIKDAPDVYVISNGMKLKIPDEKTFGALGYKFSNVIQTSDKVLNLHPQGPDIIF
ncbi:MAG: hypothetical protein V1846_02515 [Candidatus Komeilibacteria bacterium]